MKLLNGEIAPEDWVPVLGLIVALASVVFYGASKTHIYRVFFFLVLFDDHEANTTFSPGGLLFGGRMAAPPGRHRPGLPRRRRAAWTSLLQVWGVQTRSQDTRPFQRSFLKVSLNTSGLERRLFLSLRRRNHLVSDVDERVSPGEFAGKREKCFFSFHLVTAILNVSL